MSIILHLERLKTGLPFKEDQQWRHALVALVKPHWLVVDCEVFQGVDLAIGEHLKESRANLHLSSGVSNVEQLEAPAEGSGLTYELQEHVTAASCSIYTNLKSELFEIWTSEHEL